MAYYPSSKNVEIAKQFVHENPGLTSRKVYDGLHDTKLMGHLTARKCIAAMIEDGIITRRSAPNPRGGAYALVFLTEDLE